MSSPHAMPKTAWNLAGAADASVLLDFRGTIADPLWFYGIESDDARTVVRNMSEQTLRLAPESRAEKSTLSKAESAVLGCEKLRTWAASLEMSGGRGCELWRLFYRTNFVGDLEQAVSKKGDRERVLGGGDLPLQNECHEFLRYSALHFFENAHKVQKKYGPHSGAQDVGFCVSFAVDDLPAFEAVPPEQMASWKHLLQSNILDIFFDTTAEHLAKLGFERSVNVDPDATPPATKAQSNAPDSLVFPFFVAGCDEHTGKCGVNNDDKTHSSSNTAACPSCLPVSVACATALEVLRRLEGIADSDEESSSDAQLPTVIAMAFAGKHVGVWAVDRIDDTDLHKTGTCIWSGEMTRLRDVLELTVIFDKIAAWAATTFHSWVSRRVAQWMSLFPTDLAEGEEDAQISDLGVRIGNLRISRTSSFQVNGSSNTLDGPTTGK